MSNILLHKCATTYSFLQIDGYLGLFPELGISFYFLNVGRTFHFHALEKEMATHSSILAWRILGTGEAGGLPSMGSHRVEHD